MITLGTLARELGCTLSDLADMGHCSSTTPDTAVIKDDHADHIRAVWSKRTGIDYTQAAQ